MFLFDPRRHDFGSKTFLGHAFPPGHCLDEIDRALHILATSPATADHIAFKLAQRFLADNPPKAIVEAMAAAYERSGGRISATLMPLITAHEFADSLAKPAKFKEPLDYIVSTARVVCSGRPVGNGLLLAVTARSMGEAPYLHTTPDGYGARESDWLSPPAMAERTRFAMAVVARRLPLASATPDNDEIADDSMAMQQQK